MPFKKGHKHSVGNKGGGRKSALEEHNKNRALNKLWEKVADKVEAGEALTEMEEKWVAPLLSKTIKTQSEVKIDTIEVNEEVEDLIDKKINDYINDNSGDNKEGKPTRAKSVVRVQPK